MNFVLTMDMCRCVDGKRRCRGGHDAVLLHAVAVDRRRRLVVGQRRRRRRRLGRCGGRVVLPVVVLWRRRRRLVVMVVVVVVRGWHGCGRGCAPSRRRAHSSRHRRRHPDRHVCHVTHFLSRNITCVYSLESSVLVLE